jgi:ABC-type spermidine/putrescine transport system permease subunit I
MNAFKHQKTYVENLINGVLLTAIGLIILLPLMIMAVVSFWSRSGFGFAPDFTFSSYALFFSSQRVEVFTSSLSVALLTTLLMLVIAYSCAYIILKHVPQRIQRTVLFLFSAPFLVNYVVRTFAWTELLSRNGTINQILMSVGAVDNPVDWLLYSNFSVYLGLVAAYLPFMIFPIWISLSNIDRRLEHASWMLGRNKRSTFINVIFPLSLPGTLAAFIFGFVGVFGELAVSKILGGPGYQLFGNAIESSLNVVNYPLAAAMSTVAVLVMIALMIIWFLLFDIKLFLGEILGKK